MFGGQQQIEIPLSIILDTVTQKNGWKLIYYNNLICVSKETYYYTLSSMYNFKGTPELELNPSLVNLGEYIPAQLDSSMFSNLPLVINGNNFFVNLSKNIVYIKPKDITILIPRSSPYNFDLYNTFTFAGIYNPYMNSKATGTKTFLSVIPNAPAPKKEKILDTNISSDANNNLFQNTLSEYSYKIPKKEEPYPMNNMNQHPMNQHPMNQHPMNQQSMNQYSMNQYSMNQYSMNQQPMNQQKMQDTITFLIPFLTQHTSNIDSLVKTILSIIKYLPEHRILLVTNMVNISLPETIKDKVLIIEYSGYVGRLGQENILNVKIKNSYDVCSFYNYLISSYVKTNYYTIWNYNWEIKKWDCILGSNKLINVPNYYHLGDDVYISKYNSRLGYIVNRNMRYLNTPDNQDVIINKIGRESYEPNILVQGNYDIVDLKDREHILLYGNEIEMREIFNEITKDDTVPKDLMILEKIEKIVI